MYALITTLLLISTSSAKGAKTGIDRTANPDEELIKNPRKTNIISIKIAKIIFGNPSTDLLKLFNIVSLISPVSKVIFIPLANPTIRATPLLL
jgi:hypothetical protein